MNEIQVIISQGKVKRVIKGAFDVCISRDDALTIIDRFQEELKSGFSYGWIAIYEKPKASCAINQKPKEWSEK